MHPRSWLLVPVDDAALAAAPEAGADAVVVDLSDPIPLAGKAAARQRLDDWLAEKPMALDRIWVRVNGGDMLEDDVQVVRRHDVAGLLVPNATNAALLVELDHILGRRPTQLCPVIESAVGLLNSGALAAVARVSHLVIGEGHLGRELGLDPSADEAELASVRGHLVVVSAAFGKRPPIGSPPRIDADEDEVRASCDRLRRLGYGGRVLHDPAHAVVVHEVFTPSRDEAQAAVLLIDRAEKAAAEGRPLLDDDGRLIDPSVLFAAYRVLNITWE